MLFVNLVRLGGVLATTFSWREEDDGSFLIAWAPVEEVSSATSSKATSTRPLPPDVHLCSSLAYTFMCIALFPRARGANCRAHQKRRRRRRRPGYPRHIAWLLPFQGSLAVCQPSDVRLSSQPRRVYSEGCHGIQDQTDSRRHPCLVDRAKTCIVDKRGNRSHEARKGYAVAIDPDEGLLAEPVEVGAVAHVEVEAVSDDEEEGRVI